MLPLPALLHRQAPEAMLPATTGTGETPGDGHAVCRVAGCAESSARTGKLLPHPRAKTPAQQRQEENLRYVAYTRAMRELYLVRSG
jgi:hypothetical protein